MQDQRRLTYSDESITLNSNELIINKILYPLPTKKIIKIPDIKKVELIDLNRANGKYTFIGFTWTLIYYHLDRKRPGKKNGIVIYLKDSVMKYGITPDDPNKVFSMLLSFMSPFKDQSEMTSLVGGEKEKTE